MIQQWRRAFGEKYAPAAKTPFMLVQLAPLAREQLVLLEDDWLLCEGGWAALQYFGARGHF